MAIPNLSGVVHVGAATWLGGVIAYGVLSPDAYELLMQEDRTVEWATVWLFLMAGAVGMSRAIRQRRVFDGLVALFCLFVAGEEFSWGQRLIGYDPAEFFLENNYQQEANLHNLPQSFLQPKWVLMTALAGYGVLLPLLKSYSPRLLCRLGATSPALELLPWFAVAIMFLVWYPLTFTGEWVEAFAGGLFLLSCGVSSATAGSMLVVTIGLAAVTTNLAAELQHRRDQGHALCAELEISSLVTDITSGSAATDELWEMRRVHKRVWSSVSEGYLQSDRLQALNSVPCEGETDARLTRRRKYGIDPWGSPYWLEVERTSRAQRSVSVYSFGPNRRRDRATLGDESDDIRLSRVAQAR